MSKKLLAADIGSGFCKIAFSMESDGQLSYQSVVTEKPETEEFGLEAHQGVFFNGKKFLVDKLAKNFGDPAKRLDTLNDTWHGSDEWLALLYQGISQSFDEDIKEIELITGIPQRIFSPNAEMKAMIELSGELMPKDKMLKILNRKHVFIVDGVEYEVMINATVIPQAAAALIYNSYKDNSLLQEEVGVIDFGTNTTGLSVLDGGIPVGRKSGGVSIGADKLYKMVAQHLKQEYSYVPDSTKLPEIIRKKSFFLSGETISIEEHVNECAGLIFQDVMKLIEKLWDNKASDFRVYVTGGAGDLFINAVRKEIPHAEYSLGANESTTAFFDVAKGMFGYLSARV